MKKRPLLILAGMSCAGKSTIARYLASTCNLIPMEQHVIYHALATDYGYRRSREWLANVGEVEFVARTTAETARRIGTTDVSRGVIVDASYGPAMHDAYCATGILTGF